MFICARELAVERRKRWSKYIQVYGAHTYGALDVHTHTPTHLLAVIFIEHIENVAAEVRHACGPKVHAKTICEAHNISPFLQFLLGWHIFPIKLLGAQWEDVLKKKFVSIRVFTNTIQDSSGIFPKFAFPNEGIEVRIDRVWGQRLNNDNIDAIWKN